GVPCARDAFPTAQAQRARRDAVFRDSAEPRRRARNENRIVSSAIAAALLPPSCSNLRQPTVALRGIDRSGPVRFVDALALGGGREPTRCVRGLVVPAELLAEPGERALGPIEMLVVLFGERAAHSRIGAEDGAGALQVRQRGVRAEEREL